MRLKRYTDAVTVFEHALRDDTYQRRGAVEANLANSYVRAGDYRTAIAHYEAALGSAEPADAYKYYQGVAQAYMQQEQYEHAALAYKHAALDEHNPQPGKALVNLGLAMMAAGKPEAAVEAYRSALSSQGYENKGRVLLNLGVAYHAQGKWREAVRVLEEAQMLHGYGDSALAQRTLADARQRLAIEQQVAAADAALPEVSEPEPDSAPRAEPESAAEEFAGDLGAQASGGTGEPGRTPPSFDSVGEEEEEPQRESAAVPPQGGATAASELSGAAAAVITADPVAPPAFAPGDSAPDSAALDPADLAPDSADPAPAPRSEEVAQFFSRNEREIAAEGRRRARQARSPFAWLKPLLIVVALLSLLGGSTAALYFTGQGIPSPKTTVTRLLEAYNAGRGIQDEWTYAAQGNIEKQMTRVPTSPDYTIKSITPGANRSTVAVSVANDLGATLDFTFVLAREGIGWKVCEITAKSP
jgi:tetratricopeptide (TPR) repeat protein